MYVWITFAVLALASPSFKFPYIIKNVWNRYEMKPFYGKFNSLQ